MTYHGFQGFSNQTTAYASVLLIYVLSILLFALVLLGYGFHISHKLAQSYDQKASFTQVFKEKAYLLFRINVVLAICSSCYFLRAVLFLILVFEELNDTNVVSFPSLVWFLLSAWIPTAGPVCFYVS